MICNGSCPTRFALRPYFLNHKLLANLWIAYFSWYSHQQAYFIELIYWANNGCNYGHFSQFFQRLGGEFTLFDVGRVVHAMSRNELCHKIVLIISQPLGKVFANLNRRFHTKFSWHGLILLLLFNSWDCFSLLVSLFHGDEIFKLWESSIIHLTVSLIQFESNEQFYITFLRPRDYSHSINSVPRVDLGPGLTSWDDLLLVRLVIDLPVSHIHRLLGNNLIEIQSHRIVVSILNWSLGNRVPFGWRGTTLLFLKAPGIVAFFHIF